MCDECERDYRLEDSVGIDFDGTTDYDWTLDEGILLRVSCATRAPLDGRCEFPSLSARFAPGGAEREIRPFVAAALTRRNATPHSFEDAA